MRVDLTPASQSKLREGLEPRVIGDCVLDGIRNEHFWLLPHTGARSEIESRFDTLLTALEESAELGWQDEFGPLDGE